MTCTRRSESCGGESRLKHGMRNAMKKVLLSAAVAVATFAAVEVQAFPVTPTAGGNTDAILVAGGCGPGFHRGPHGGCRRNVVPVCRWVRTPHGPRKVCG